MASFFRARRDRVLSRPLPDAPLPLLRAGAPLPARVERAIPDGSSQWPISPALARVLAHAVLGHGRRNVLELGAGSSSLVLAEALAAAGGGRLTSVESAPEWCTAQWEEIRAIPTIDARLIEATPRLRASLGGLAFEFVAAREAVRARGPYDLVLVDAPQHFFGRDGALPLIRRSLAPGALILLDDAGREGERYTLARWLSTYPELRLLALDREFGARGVAVLTSIGGPLQPRFDPWSAATSVLHLLRGRRERRRAARQSITPAPPPSAIG